MAEEKKIRRIGILTSGGVPRMNAVIRAVTHMSINDIEVLAFSTVTPD